MNFRFLFHSFHGSCGICTPLGLLAWRVGRGSIPRVRAAALALSLALVGGLSDPTNLPAQTLSTNSGLARVQLSSAYEYQPVSVTPNALAPALPLDLAQITNASLMTQELGLSQDACQALVRNGFVVVPNGRAENIADVYCDLGHRGIATFITSDSMLHLYHLQFDGILRTVETNRFLPQLKAMSSALLARAADEYASVTGDLREAARRNMGFYSVALKLLGEPVVVPGPVADAVAGELAKIEAHAGFATSLLFNYNEDYSQYVPRGHYTLSDDLKRYFKAMMRYGRMTFLLKGTGASGDALVSGPEARIQTLAALLMTLDLDQSPECAATWNQIYGVTAFFVGLADDLTPYDYKTALMQVFGAQVNVLSLTDEANFLALRKALAAMPNPQIYGGTGNILLPPGATAADLDAVLNKTKGMRLMGQRFIPDSYMMQQLVFPAVGSYRGAGSPFTLVWSEAGAIRGFPRGLDVMVVLGSQRALSLLDSQGDTEFADYDLRINELLRMFSSFGQAEWTRNLYWSWLYALRPLLEPCGPGYPPFMRTTAWQDKQLNTALASWAELRHDTILYAKQSYTVGTTSTPQDPKVLGYVEPVPEVFERLRALTSLTRAGLTGLNVLEPGAATRLGQLESMLARLKAISIKELQGLPLDTFDTDFIGQFYLALSSLTDEDADSDTQKTIMVADVHTDPNSGSVLEEGVGYVKLLVAGCALPQGSTFLAAGPVFTGYEFKWPMANRLTDESWTNLLVNGTAPAAPAWMGSFMAPVTVFSDTDPSRTAAVQLMRPQLRADGLRLQWLGENARRYRALYSEDLANWFLLQTPVAATQSGGEVVDRAATNAACRFYIVKPIP